MAVASTSKSQSFLFNFFLMIFLLENFAYNIQTCIILFTISNLSELHQLVGSIMIQILRKMKLFDFLRRRVIGFLCPPLHPVWHRVITGKQERY